MGRKSLSLRPTLDPSARLGTCYGTDRIPAVPEEPGKGRTPGLWKLELWEPPDSEMAGRGLAAGLCVWCTNNLHLPHSPPSHSVQPEGGAVPATKTGAGDRGPQPVSQRHAHHCSAFRPPRELGRPELQTPRTSLTKRGQVGGKRRPTPLEWLGSDVAGIEASVNDSD